MRTNTYAYLLLISGSLGIGCSGTELAPDCFLQSDNGKCLIPEGPAPEMSLDCGTPPVGAVGAQYSHFPTFEGPSSVTFDADNLPEGLQIGANTGQISGAPTTAGMYPDVVLKMTDDVSGASVEATCPSIEVVEALSHDLFDKPATAPYGCIAIGDNLDNHIMGGTGVDYTCSVAGVENEDQGEGVIPAGVTFDADTCSASGSPTEDFHGTWVWMVEVKQASFSIYVPFCATKEVQTFHDVAFTNDGQAVDVLEPMLLPVKANEEVRFGDGDTLEFEVTAECAGNSCVTWAYQHRMYWSPIEKWSALPDGTIKDMNGNLNIGFFHHFSGDSDGMTPAEQGFAGRAWTAPFRFWYCTSGNAGDCNPQDEDLVMKNAQTKLVWSVIAYPDPG